LVILRQITGEYDMKNVLPIFEFYISSMYHLLHGISDYAGKYDWHPGIISPVSNCRAAGQETVF
jgi:hypothetical protein